MRYQGSSVPQKEKVEWWLAGARGKDDGERCLVGTELQFGKMKTFWRWIVVVVIQQYECLIPLKNGLNSNFMLYIFHN
jgi:hypothetical protein